MRYELVSVAYSVVVLMSSFVVASVDDSDLLLTVFGVEVDDCEVTSEVDVSVVVTFFVLVCIVVGVELETSDVEVLVVDELAARVLVDVVVVVFV